LREFVVAMFGSPEQLDVFVLLHGDPGRAWTPAQVAATLGMASESAGMRLFLLSAAGLLEASGGAAVEYRFASDPALAPFAQQTAAAYAADRGQLYALVSGGSRPDPARRFADAFKLRKP
jgi:hypothetical protein